LLLIKVRLLSNEIQSPLFILSGPVPLD